MVVTGLTKLKMNGIFSDYENVTLATSNGLVYSWGRNLLTAEEWDEQQLARQHWDDTHDAQQQQGNANNNRWDNSNHSARY